MAIAGTKMSDLIGDCEDPSEILQRLRRESLLSPDADDAKVVQAIEAAFANERRQIATQGFTWATGNTLVPGQLLMAGLLSQKGIDWANPPSKSWWRRFFFPL